jgi:2-polyprenyl-3-methyl-5-hydroxy-6-metoxy-1,4-benzoquinol methylase
MIHKNKIGTTFFLKFSDSLFDNVWKVGNMWLKKKNKKFIDKLTLYSNVDLKHFDPIYYCQECQRLEDGCHRSWVMKNKGLNGATVLIGRVCWKKMENLLLQLKKLIEEKKLKSKDLAWTTACETKKWAHLKKINFSQKTYLDVGSQSGYSAFMGWNLGAIKVDGVEIRKEIFDVAKTMRNQLNANEVTFYNDDWVKVKSNFGQYDIVSCMGLLHYFNAEIYDEILEDLCNKTKNTLILDLRVWDNPKSNHHIVGTQTLITRTHLTDILNKKGFTVKIKIDNTHKEGNIQGKRELWIMERYK